MGWMKWVNQIGQSYPSSISSLRSKIKKAKAENLNYCIFEGELITLEQADAVISLVINQKKNDKVHRESDTVQQQD